MKSSVKRLLSFVVVLAMALSLLPGIALATDEILVAEGSANFATDMAAFNGRSEYFTPETNGDVTVEILSCTPGYYVDLYEDGEWIEDHLGTGADTVTFPVTAGIEYEILLCSYNADDPNMAYAQAGSVSYKITFVSNGEVPDEEEPVDPSLIPGATQGNPLVITVAQGGYIEPGQTVWYLYDNYQNMVDNGVYSMMLHINSGATYSVTYASQDVPVDEYGFVTYKMEDTDKLGQYLFCVTNNGTEKKFFTVDVRECPVYVFANVELAVGRNNITLDASVPYTLYEFTPTQTGIYQIKAAQGLISNWGTAYNPVNSTTDKTNTLIWTCTAVGQSVMVGFNGPKTTTCTIIRTGAYVPPVEIPWTYYENTYNFSYALNADAQTVDVDLTDGGEHIAVLGEDGFYHYGSADGPLMVANLADIEINLSDAALNGGLRAWLQDEDGETISKIDYNDALLEYLKAGLVPVTEELAIMLLEVGQANGWWSSGGMVFTGDAPEDLSQAWMQLCAYLVEDEGVTLSGAVTTGAESDTTIELLQNGEVIAAVTATGKEGTYTLENIPAGTYTLKASKENHITREYTVTLDAEALTQDVQICLIGDADGNGKINMGDVAKVLSHIRNSAPITDAYQLLCSNVNGGSLNMGDIAQLYAHIKGTQLLY